MLFNMNLGFKCFSLHLLKIQLIFISLNMELSFTCFSLHLSIL
jgi:hypothetical protein